MDRNRLEGIGHQVKGTLKEGLGRIIGDAKLTTDGAAEKSAGQAQSAAARNSGQVVGIDADRIVGIGHQLKGAVRQGFGSITGDPALVEKGIEEREAGKKQNAAGSIRDEAREAEQAKREQENANHDAPNG
jgi:uncharacterized protein YjbJ (UPF0337 family)